jgi:transposase
MKHVGIDLGATESSICVVRADGAIEQERKIRTDELGRWFERLNRDGPARIAMETCSESRLIALQAKAAGHQVCVVPSVIVRALGVGARRIKTDRKDAQALALASYRLRDNLPNTHLRCDESAAAAEMIGGRAGLVQQRTRTTNFVRAHLRKNLIGRPRASAKTFTKAVRTTLQAHGESPSPVVEAYLQMIDAINKQIDSLDAQIAKQAQTDVHRRLREVPGVGPLIAVAFVAMIDDPKRFSSAADVASYLGLSPGENTTGGGKPRRTGMIGSGQTLLRVLLVQGSHALLRSNRTDPLAMWGRQLATKRNRRLAVVAVARRLAVMLWAMIRDGTKYDPRLTQPRPPRAASSSSSTTHGPATAAAEVSHTT